MIFPYSYTTQESVNVLDFELRVVERIKPFRLTGKKAKLVEKLVMAIVRKLLRCTMDLNHEDDRLYSLNFIDFIVHSLETNRCRDLKSCFEIDSREAR
jgi:hypothetical protein